MNRPDVVVIGSGAGGAAFAWGLASRGVKVHILEAGPRYTPPTDYHLAAPDWERLRFPEKVPAGGRQTHAPFQRLESQWDDLRSWNHLTGRLVTATERAFWAYSHVVGVGGSTLHYAG